jgi:hypothetical protein
MLLLYCSSTDLVTLMCRTPRGGEGRAVPSESDSIQYCTSSLFRNVEDSTRAGHACL